MMVSEFRFVVLDDPILAVLWIGGVACFLGGAVMRWRGGRRWDRLLYAGAILLGASFVYALARTWLTPLPA